MKSNNNFVWLWPEKGGALYSLANQRSLLDIFFFDFDSTIRSADIFSSSCWCKQHKFKEKARRRKCKFFFLFFVFHFQISDLRNLHSGSFQSLVSTYKFCWPVRDWMDIFGWNKWSHMEFHFSMCLIISNTMWTESSIKLDQDVHYMWLMNANNLLHNINFIFYFYLAIVKQNRIIS